MAVVPFPKREQAPVAIVDSSPSPRAECPPPHDLRRWSDDARSASAADAPATPPAGSVQAPQATSGDSDEAPYRVLVVEDDASQALFAEGVLRGAGIDARAARTAAQVIPEMEQFHPDLVLMDLHMPGMSGTDLTALIRLHPAFAYTPIVFLTGDPDPERQFEALENGADDFLSKPIRPRHLLAAVHSRLKRARALQRQHSNAGTRNAATGLLHRSHLLGALAAALSTEATGGALVLDIQSASALRERYGYAGFEQLMHDVGHRVVLMTGASSCARLNDSAFLVFAPGVDAPQLGALARSLRDGISHPAFEHDGIPLRLRAAIGYTALMHFSDPGSLLDAVEQAARAARAEPIGLIEHTPVAAPAEPPDELIAAIRSGLSVNAFELAFQAVVAVAGGQDAQFQVLLRMRDPEGVLHRAGALVPAAEAAGLMPEIDRWVLQQAIELLHRRRVEQHPLRLFVTQSPRTLAHDLHAEWLLGMLISHGIDGPSLVIDLRLDDALVHSVTLRQFSEQLMPAGVKFCLSQFVHGAESDALLEQLPLSYLRLAPRYSQAHSDSKLRDELRMIINRANPLGLQVIGPQVEDPQGAATLWMSGIDLIQGNLVQQADGDLNFDFANAVL